MAMFGFAAAVGLLPTAVFLLIDLTLWRGGPPPPAVAEFVQPLAYAGMWAALIVATAAAYFAPAIVAADRRHPGKAGILTLNLLLGWTVLGWIAALIWALNRPRA